MYKIKKYICVYVYMAYMMSYNLKYAQTTA